MSGLFVSQSLLRVWPNLSETETLQIVLESFCVLSPAHTLSPTFCREALFACPPFPPWNLSSFTLESTLPSPCSDFPLFRQGAALAHFDSFPSHDLLTCTDGSIPFGKSYSVLANYFRGSEVTISYLAGPVCSNLSAETCAILQALC